MLNRQIKNYLLARQYAAKHFQSDGVVASDLTYSKRNELRKSIRTKPDVDLNARSIEVAITRMAKDYSKYETDPRASEPWPEGVNIIAYSAQTAYLFHDTGRYYLCVPGKNDHLILPLVVSDDQYHQEALPNPEAAKDSGRRPGTALEDFGPSDFQGTAVGLGQCSVVKRGPREFELHLSVKREQKASRNVTTPRYIVGVDRGRNQLIYAALYDRKEDHVKQWVNVSGDEVENMMDQVADRIAECQQAGVLEEMDKLRRRRRRFKRQKDYEAANEIVDLAHEGLRGQSTLESYGVVIVLEYLSGMSRLGGYSAERRRFAEWSYYRQYLAIKNKAEPYDISIESVESAYTSRKCARCGVDGDETHRSGIHFECESCGYEIHADANAAVNIAKRYAESLEA
ncbi:IS1341-type transposase [Natrinema versiforme JCM 10478]|uniref:IS1341-type transposase n=2 Tax=Natrinema versiforme TaxID=88724 RepID=L9Y4A5_9EURY|nr:IS1341-type transposase [Natrinema versiforme JCM 10478]